jgi:hypothetical protein
VRVPVSRNCVCGYSAKETSYAVGYGSLTAGCFSQLLSILVERLHDRESTQLDVSGSAVIVTH